MKFFKMTGPVSESATNSVHPPGNHSLFKSLAAGIAASAIMLSGSFSVYAETEGLEKEDLKFGFIKLTDMAPLAIAYEKGYFEDEGLYVTNEKYNHYRHEVLQFLYERQCRPGENKADTETAKQEEESSPVLSVVKTEAA